MHCVPEMDRNQFELREARMSLVARSSLPSLYLGKVISVESLFWTQGDRGRIAHDFGRELVLDAGRPGTDRS